MNLTELKDQLPSPNSIGGPIVLCILQTVTIVFISYFSINVTTLMERIVFSICFCPPLALLIRSGHFGETLWRTPTIPALTYLIWAGGLLPSLVGASSPESGVSFYSSTAKLVGVMGCLIWFTAFAIGSGKTTGRKNFHYDINSQSIWVKFDAMVILCLLGMWVGSGFVAAEASAISAWSPSVMQQLQGTSQGGMVLFYLTFIPLVVVLGVSGWLLASKTYKILYGSAIIIGLVGLILYSNRRLVIFIGVVIIYLFISIDKKVRLRKLLFITVTSVVMLGPLLWPIRVAFSNPEVMLAQENPLGIASEAIVRYFSEPGFREIVSDASSENIQGGRFNYADSYLSGVEWNLGNGYPGSPTFLFTPVVMIPSSLWGGKVDFARELNIKNQWNAYGITNQADFPMTPLQEIFFQYGWLGVIIGGWLWGWMARKAEDTFQPATTQIEKLLVWLAFVIGLFSFEGGFSSFLSLLREPVAMAVIVALVRKVVTRGEIQQNYIFQKE